MRLRRFSGRSSQEVLVQVKAALGPDPVILETEERDGVVTITAATDADERPAAPREGALAAEVRELSALVRHLALGGSGPGEATPELARLRGALLAQGVDGAIAGALLREAGSRLDASTPLDAALAGALARPDAPDARVRVFVGPPGDGKTTVVAKLAAREQRAGRRVALIGTDTHRVGAQAQLETYGRVLGVPVTRAEAPRQLRRALLKAADADVVLVDTAGTAPPAELSALLAAAGSSAVPTLVASAGTGAAAAARLWTTFAELGPAACVMTKLDLAPAGPLLGTLWHHGLAVSHLGLGPGIGDGLEPATASRLARELLAA